MDLNEASPDQLTPEDCGETSPRPNKFVCKYQECLKVFKAKKSLNDHTRIHKGEKPFLCSFNPCDKAFTQFSSLQKHERIHKGEKPYVCENCGKAFTQISNLKRHERSHRGERPHSCDVCAKEFTTSSNLKQHLQVHLQKESRDKFECNSCGKTYSYNSSLKKHLQEHNPEQPKTESPEDPVTSFQLRTEFRSRESFENARGLAQINAISEPLNFTINQNLHNFYELAYNPLTLPQNHFTVFQEFQRNLIMPGLVQNSVFGRGASDLSSLKRSVDANKMNPGRRAYKQHQHFHVHSLACEHIMILHQGHLDYLHDGKLHHVSSDGCLEEHELEISDQNPIACKPVNNNNTSSTCGHNSHHNHFSKQTLSERNCANSSSCCNAVKELPAVLPLNHHGTLEEMTSICKGDISFTKHVHSETCNHPMIIHNGHIDFIVEGKLHHVHEDHYDDHGSVHIVDKSFEIQKFTQIASRTNQIFPRYS